MENNMEERQYYTVCEIIGTLRDYLKEGYKILYDMMALVDIKSDVPYFFEIKIAQGSACNFLGSHVTYKDGLYGGKILLFITKTGFFPIRLLRDIKTLFNEENDPLYSVDHADFIVDKVDEEFVFKKRYNHDIPRTYKPMLTIIDKEEFARLYQRLEDEGYLTFPDFLYFSNSKPDFSFGIGSQRISLQQSDYNGRGLMIEYDPSDDTLFVKDDRKKPELTIDEMFNLKIPREEIYEGYASIIDKNLAVGNIYSFGELTTGYFRLEDSGEKTKSLRLFW